MDLISSWWGETGGSNAESRGKLGAQGKSGRGKLVLTLSVGVWGVVRPNKSKPMREQQGSELSTQSKAVSSWDCGRLVLLPMQYLQETNVGRESTQCLYFASQGLNGRKGPEKAEPGIGYCQTIENGARDVHGSAILMQSDRRKKEIGPTASSQSGTCQEPRKKPSIFSRPCPSKRTSTIALLKILANKPGSRKCDPRSNQRRPAGPGGAQLLGGVGCGNGGVPSQTRVGLFRRESERACVNTARA
ncbi:hypothetical protein V8F20_008961 [Naviculisporaceae sp. PSN 640]